MGQSWYALCEDGYPVMSHNHPRRLGWLEFAQQCGYVCQQKLERSYNGGFLGLRQSQKSLLLDWQKLTGALESLSYLNLSDSHHNSRANSLYKYPYVGDDQVILNLTLMVTNHPLSTFGPEAMDFSQIGGIMSHAAGGSVVKPWRKK